MCGLIYAALYISYILENICKNKYSESVVILNYVFGYIINPHTMRPEIFINNIAIQFLYKTIYSF